MPIEVERCVAKLLKDPKFKPQAGKTKKESAWAICNAAQKKAKGFDNILPFVSIVTGKDGKIPRKIQVLPIGLWDAPYLPEHVKNEQDQLEITANDIDEIIANFNADIRKGVPIDIEHSGGEAAGWMTALERVGNFLEATVEWTKLGIEKIKAKQFKFFSPEFSPNYTDPQTGEKKGWVLIGGGLVNRPLFKELAPITAKENLTGDSGYMILLSKTQSNSHMNKKLEAILAKDKADLTDEEKAYIRANEGELSDEQKEEHKDTLETEGEEEGAGEGGDNEGDEGGDEGDEGGDNSEGEEEGEEEGEGKTVTGKEKTVAIKASELKELQANAKQGVEALNRLRTIEASEKAQQYIVGSENGRILPAGKDDLTALILSFDKTQAKLFNSVMKNVPDAQMFKEIGKDESNVGTNTQQFEKLIEKIQASDKLQYKDALKKARILDPKLYKAYTKEVNSTK